MITISRASSELIRIQLSMWIPIQSTSLYLNNGCVASYKPEEVFDEEARLIPELKQLASSGIHRMSANSVGSGGVLRKALGMPDVRGYKLDQIVPEVTDDPRLFNMTIFLRELLAANMQSLRIFGPDETE